MYEVHARHYEFCFGISSKVLSQAEKWDEMQVQTQDHALGSCLPDPAKLYARHHILHICKCKRADLTFLACLETVRHFWRGSQPKREQLARPWHVAEALETVRTMHSRAAFASFLSPFCTMVPLSIDMQVSIFQAGAASRCGVATHPFAKVGPTPTVSSLSVYASCQHFNPRHLNQMSRYPSSIQLSLPCSTP